MSKSGGWAKKLTDKASHNATRRKMGTHKPMIARTMTPFAEKVVALREHIKLIHSGVNPKAAECFHGDGLPDEVIHGSKNWGDAKPPKTNSERALEDKRKSLKGEMVEGWKPRRFGKRARSGCVLAR